MSIAIPDDTARSTAAAAVPKTAIPAAAGALLGGSGTTGAAAAVTVGAGLALASGILSTSISGVTIDGSTIPGSTGTPYVMPATVRVVDVNKTTGAPTAITLPASPTLWVEYKVIDGKRDAATNNITVSPASGTINGAANFVLSANADAIAFLAVSSSAWRIV